MIWGFVIIKSQYVVFKGNMCWVCAFAISRHIDSQCLINHPRRCVSKVQPCDHFSINCVKRWQIWSCRPLRYNNAAWSQTCKRIAYKGRIRGTGDGSREDRTWFIKTIWGKWGGSIRGSCRRGSHGVWVETLQWKSDQHRQCYPLLRPVWRPWKPRQIWVSHLLDSIRSLARIRR